MTLLYLVWYGLSMLALAIFVHEAGHILALKVFGRDTEIRIRLFPPKVYAGYPTDYMGLSENQKGIIYVTGIFAGALFIILLPFGLLEKILLLVIYLIGCHKDFVKIQQLDNPKTQVVRE